MCYMIFQPQKKEIKESVLREIFEKNPDGIGYATIVENYYTYQNKNYDPKYEMNYLKIQKGFFEFDEFFNLYKKSVYMYTGPVLIHFRKATNGSISKENCHPFYIGQYRKMCYAHRGDLNLIKEENSDSKNFALDLNLFTLKEIFHPSFIYLLNMYFKNNNSEAIFLNKHGNYFLCGNWKYINEVYIAGEI